MSTEKKNNKVLISVQVKIKQEEGSEEEEHCVGPINVKVDTSELGSSPIQLKIKATGKKK